jgi:EEF1A lysine methyltransferase 4
MPNYGDPRYWDDRYKSHQQAIFDWLENYDTLKPLLTNLIDKHQRILNVGCGNGELTEAMFDDGYTSIINMDISQVVIDLMASRNTERPGMVWEVGDAMDMKYDSESFDVVIDKSMRYITRHSGRYSLRQAVFLQRSINDKGDPKGA